VPSQPGPPSSPSPQGGSTGGQALQPSLTVSPGHVQVGVKVQVPPVVPLPVHVPPVDTHVDLNLPKPALPLR
jgi:hypothetical protein